MTDSTWTKTETIRRLREASKLARRQCGMHPRVKTEIGGRVIPSSTMVPPLTRDEATVLCYPEGDDLSDYSDREDAAKWVRPGEVVHVYVSEAPEYFGGDAYLCDAVVVWLGYGEHEPRVIDTAVREIRVMSESVTVWRAVFTGHGENTRIITTSYSATRTERRVAVHGAGSFNSDEYMAPDAVSYTEMAAVVKLLAYVTEERQYAEAKMAEALRMEQLLALKLKELS